MIPKHIFLRKFSKTVCFSTLFLIFAGGLVTSTGSGLAVPDWPLSYGTLFPPMVGGVFYEHGHRMIASTVGFLMLCLAGCLGLWEKRLWVKILGFIALGAVIVQGILGGITVLFFLPTPVSVAHGMLAQTFFLLTIFLAYSQSQERQTRENEKEIFFNSRFLKLNIFLIGIIYLQLLIGAVMRHTGSGLAIPDFPTMGGSFWPTFDENMVAWVNLWRFEHDLDPVTKGQILIHFLHRLGALVIAVTVIVLTWQGGKEFKNKIIVTRTIFLIDFLVISQIILGVLTVVTQKSPHVTTLHVMVGAATLGAAVLLALRVSPVSFKKFKKVLNNNHV
ncbi:MAG: hypothetical protein A2787_04180 [Omnitrophica WOR_2 bacterium RIFCSPHIGHO2_01_FULL_48_9]|nr:MAG: hypothetical protein A3D10_07420 [Omnitrophica WOR_2 bacterium RIFCSPHIGHO2_02_FULL_48_11]OGX34182.1 MAG: hypothetical protein A2787_04180 [Omnitrophica WOR_2 bacterium RIFCSPHIGHO2_01_FULL_48_9]